MSFLHGGFMANGKMTNNYCNVCSQQLNTWDMRLSKILAYKNPVCEACIAEEYDMDVNALREKMENFFGLRPCVGI